MDALVAVGYASAAALFALLAVLLLTSWRGRLQGGLLLLAVVVSAVWAGAFAIQAMLQSLPSTLLWSLEALRGALWVAFLSGLLIPTIERSRSYGRFLRGLRNGVFLICLVLVLPFDHQALIAQPLPSWVTNLQTRFLGQLAVAVAGLAFVEQLYRNTPQDQRWGIKHLCIGLGCMFVYDFALFADALLFKRLNADLWSARGAVNALIVPLIALSTSRNPHWSLSLFVSRKAVFHTTTLFAAGLYMLLMSLAGYYIKARGGEWGGFLQTVFLFAAGLMLLVLLFSGQLRSQIKVLLSKHLHHSRYDYRDEWLRLVRTLTGKDTESHLFERVIRALGEIVDSPAGLLWLCQAQGGCAPVAGWNRPVPRLHAGMRLGPLADFFRSREWVVNLEDSDTARRMYDGVPLPSWIDELEDVWLIVPLLHEDSVQGFVVLSPPRARITLNWEDLDLIRTAARQAAGYIAQYRAAKALSEARQFEGFNRLSAYVIHDLKNLIAQLSLVAKNARRHRDNPAFLEDAVTTIENAVGKMNRLLLQLRSAAAEGEAVLVDLRKVLREVVQERSGQRPVPSLDDGGEEVWVESEVDRLASVLGHVVQNAQDATPPDGRVQVRLRGLPGQAIVEVRDTGVGMDEEFIRERLFQPFYSTKGLTGMGVGAYECRDFVQAAGGSVDVASVPGEGTTFTVFLPRAEATAGQGQGRSAVENLRA
jgi:putative PEP-CTERM system histidine kinase